MPEPIKPFRRNRYFSGKLLTPAELQAEQQYHMGKQQLSNRLLLGMGVAEGLECSWSQEGGLVIEPGVAIDCIGREVVVPERQTIHVPPEPERVDLGLALFEREVGPQPMAPDSHDAREVESGIIEESFEIVLVGSALAADHARRSDGRWTCCGAEHPVPIARLRWKNGRLRVRRPRKHA